MSFTAAQISEFTKLIALALRHPNEPLRLIEAASVVLSFQAAICIINRKHRTPLYLCDTYTDKSAKQAVQLYAKSTYLINPVYNAFLGNLETGLYRMRDLEPGRWSSRSADDNVNTSLDSAEEIGFLTRGWPARLEELVLVSRLSDKSMVEISFAQPSSMGGFSDRDIDCFRAYLPLFLYAMDAIYENSRNDVANSGSLAIQLEAFAGPLLTQRENEVIQLVLQGYSGKLICTTLGISMPTLKSHRKNAYNKLDVRNSQELFNRFILWKHQMDNHS
jgi:DNA-binding CsgD family transcriptional regulator